MSFWIVTLVLLVVAALTVLLPLAFARRSASPGVESSDIYRQQLLQIDAEIEAGQGDSATLETQRAEVGRRLLRAVRQEKGLVAGKTSGATAKVGASLAALVFVPAITLSLYAKYGYAGRPDFPLSARSELKLEDRPIEDLVAVAEKQLQKNPDDVKGWQLLANVYGKINQPNKRAHALRQVIRISGETPQVLSELGEALTVAGGNIVSAEARALFEKALKSDRSQRKASIYLALALDQEGKSADALNIWRDLAKVEDRDARWGVMVASQIALLEAKLGRSQPKGPVAEGQVARAPVGRAANAQMINAMVDGLASRLEEEPGTIDEWSRLIRSYMVLERSPEAAEALQRARQRFEGEARQLAELNQLQKQLGVAELAGPPEQNTEKQDP